MIGRKDLPLSYIAWNHRWRAPLPTPLPQQAKILRAPLLARRVLSPFAFQPNSTMRAFEYPWAYEQAAPGPGKKIVELGGALSGFQFTLASAGATVINVDPFYNYGSTSSYDDLKPSDMIDRLNRAWRCNVRLRQSTIDNAGFAEESIDVVVCISTLEHLPAEQMITAVETIEAILRPGGKLVLTADLFLDLAPFTRRITNKWGTNADLFKLFSSTSFRMDQGNPAELNGYPEFDARVVLENLGELFVGSYPAVPQALVLIKN